MKTILKWPYDGGYVLLLLTVFVMTSLDAQGKSENHQISGTVVNVDAVGNIITIQTGNQKKMAFAVPDKVSITQETHDIGLMDIRIADPVAIQYSISQGKYIIVSIVDNKHTF